MRKTFGMNKHQKAAHKPGERKSSSVEVAEMLQLSCSLDPEDRLTAAEHLCPCHVRKRLDPVWEALYRMMEDVDPRVRMASWHTLEDGGVPDDEETMNMLERLFKSESDPKVRRFAQQIVGSSLRQREAQQAALLQLPARPKFPKRGKCDFCGQDNIPVDFDPETPIPTDVGTRTAMICQTCARA